MNMRKPVFCDEETYMKQELLAREKTILPRFMAGVEIKTASIPPLLKGATARGILWQAAPGRFLLDVPEVSQYLVEDGSLVTIEPVPQAGKDKVNRFFQMTPLAALLFQRGITAFHAAAAAGPQGAVLLAGDSCAGKSTLLVELLKRGWKMLSDDLSVVALNDNGTASALPTFPDVVLWRDTLDKFNIENTGKYRQTVCMEEQFTNTPQRLKAICRLMVHNKNEIEISSTEGIGRFRFLTEILYNTRIADALLDRTAHMRTASALTQCVSMQTLLRPRGRWSSEELADVVEQKCQ